MAGRGRSPVQYRNRGLSLIGRSMYETRPITPIHPGEILAGELEELDMTAAQLARELHVPANRIYQLVAGKRSMTAATALRLEQWLGVSAQFWLNLQKSYELDVARRDALDEIKRRVKPREHAA